MMKELEPIRVSVLPSEYTLIQRIRSMWARHCRDDEIRDVLHLSMDEWRYILKVMKEINFAEADNRIAYEKYTTRAHERARELKSLRTYAESHDNLLVAVKCYQMETELDKSLIEVGQKLGVLTGEVIKVETTVAHNHRLESIFEGLNPEQIENATQDLIALSQMIEGIADDGTGTSG